MGFCPHPNYWGRVPGLPPRVYAYAGSQDVESAYCKKVADTDSFLSTMQQPLLSTTNRNRYLKISKALGAYSKAKRTRARAGKNLRIFLKRYRFLGFNVRTFACGRYTLHCRSTIKKKAYRYTKTN